MGTAMAIQRVSGNKNSETAITHMVTVTDRFAPFRHGQGVGPQIRPARGMAGAEEPGRDRPAAGKRVFFPAAPTAYGFQASLRQGWGGRGGRGAGGGEPRRAPQ